MTEQKILETRCPLCNSDQVRSRGSIPHSESPVIAGVPIDLSGICFQLTECLECGYQFKSPSIDKDVLLDCYSKASGDHWRTDPDPLGRMFDRISAVIPSPERHPRVLDIGAFNGAFLSFLDDGYQKYGVEPGTEPAKLAHERGVNILGSTIDEIGSEKFDVIVAIDVLEHLPEPAEFFQKCCSALNPNGRLVFFTGTTDSFFWRLQRGRYWYSSIPEHVGFFNMKCLRSIESRFGLNLVHSEKMMHERYSFSRQLIATAYHWAYTLAYATGITRRRGPSKLAVRDHLLICFESK